MKSFRRPDYSASLVCFLSFVGAFTAQAQQNASQVDPKTYGGMKWRLIGPFRGGRVIAVVGAQPAKHLLFRCGCGRRLENH